MGSLSVYLHLIITNADVYRSLMSESKRRRLRGQNYAGWVVMHTVYISLNCVVVQQDYTADVQKILI